MRLIVKEPGTLLQVVIDREITREQLEAIQIVLEDDKMAFNVREDVRISNLMREQYAGWGGIEQFQAEDR